MTPATRSPFIVRLAATADGGVVDEVLALAGVDALSPYWRRHGPNLLTLRAPDRRRDLCPRLAAHAGVDRAIALGATRLYSRWPDGDPAPPVLGNGATFVDAEPLVIAGPCSVEGPAQIAEIAGLVAAAGARALRGGVFKPRTSPYDFGGLGGNGLQVLVEAGRAHGLPVCTEVLEPGCLEAVARQADLLQIGTRNMHNTPLLFALGAHPRGRPALLKRGFGATVDEFLEAAEYFLLGRIAAGHADPGLVLCERGVRTFETSTRFTLDVAAISVLRSRSHLPVIVDPSHPAGDRRLVQPLATAGIAAGAQGLIVEVHTDPDRAWCDGPQSLDPRGFQELMSAVRLLRAGGERSRSGSNGTASRPTSMPAASATPVHPREPASGRRAARRLPGA